MNAPQTPGQTPGPQPGADEPPEFTIDGLSVPDLVFFIVALDKIEYAQRRGCVASVIDLIRQVDRAGYPVQADQLIAAFTPWLERTTAELAAKRAGRWN